MPRQKRNHSQTTQENQTKICIITMTYNRPEYIKRSFDSLYRRAGCPFDHYVFDDASDAETTKMLKTLQKRYKFNLIQNEITLGIFKNFHTHIREIPDKYDYYIKLDSDIELLSDNLVAEMTEVFGLHHAICGVAPKAEGVYCAQRSEERMGPIQFYNSHSVRIGAPVTYGCCLMFSKKVFESFPRMTDDQLKVCTDKWAIDSVLYAHALTIGKFVIIEDLSVYHIDNTYGQRKRDMRYFTSRNRWGKIDKDEVWYMRLSKDINPQFLDRSVMELLKRSSGDDYESFLKVCKSALKHGIINDTTKLDSVMIPKVQTVDVTQETVKQPTTENIVTTDTGEKSDTSEIAASVKVVEETIKDMNKELKTVVFRISSPVNFIRSKHLKKGEVRYYATLPSWSNKDPGITVETEVVLTSTLQELIYVEPSNLI